MKLRRAALRLRNKDGLVLDPDVDEALSSVATELGMPKQDLICTIPREWLEANAYLPVHDMDEGSDTDGAA